MRKVWKKKYKGRKKMFNLLLESYRIIFIVAPCISYRIRIGLLAKCGLFKSGRLLRKLWSDGNIGEYAAT